MARRRFAVQGIAFQIALCVLLLLMVGVPAGLAAPPQPEARGPARGMWAGGVYEDIAVDASPMAARASSAGALGSAGACAALSPNPLTPAAGATSNDLVTPTYTWSVTAGIIEYIFQVAENGDFDKPLATEWTYVAAGATAVRHGSFYDLEKNHTYYWRVASVCADGQIGPFSTPSSFTTGGGSGNPPCNRPPPTLQAPADGAQLATLVPQHAWRSMPGTWEYVLQRATNSAFNGAASTHFFNADPAYPVVTFTNSRNLPPNQIYYWRVASECAETDTVGSYSGAFSYRTGPVGGAFPSAPALIAPANGVTTASIRVTLMYGSVPGADMYNVRLYSSLSDAQSDYPDHHYSTSNMTVIDVSNPETTWYWRVKSRNGYGWGDLSEIRMFRTPSLTASTTISPEAGGTLSPSAGFLTVNFPPGAVSSPTELNFYLQAAPQHPMRSYQYANRAFTLEAVAQGQPVTQFAKPYTMLIRYDLNDLAAAGIDDPLRLNLFFWTEDGWRGALPCAGCSIDLERQTVTVVLDHLTGFALAAPADTSTQLFLPLIKR